MKTKIPFKFGKRLNLPKTAQSTVPFIEAYDNGIFLSGENSYTLIFAFDNLDYSLFREHEQQKTYEDYQQLLNTLPTDISYQEFIMNSNVNTEKILRTLIPNSRRYEKVYDDYCRIQRNFIKSAETASSDKIMVIALCYQPWNKIDSVNVLFKCYRELQTYFNNLKIDTRQLMPEEVFAIIHEFYHPFDDIDFLLPQNIYSKGGSIKDYIAPSMFAFKAKEIEIGESFTRVLFVSRIDRELDDGLIRDLLDNNKKVTVSKHLRRFDKNEALDKIRGAIFNVQGSIQDRMAKNHKSGTNFIPFRLKEKLEELEEMQRHISSSNCELFEVGIFISLSEETKEKLDELTKDIRGKALKHQVKLDVFIRQQEKALNSILPFGINHFSEKTGNNVNTNLPTDQACILIPFSTKNYFSENGICYGLNKQTFAMIILDRTDEMNANGFTLGSSGSGKSVFTKSEINDVLMKYPDDEIIVIDPDNEYYPLLEYFDGEIFKLSPASEGRMNIFDTDLSYSEEGSNAISMKSGFIMTIVETVKGLPLTANERSLIDRCVKEVYVPFIHSKGDKTLLPTLIDFHKLLLEQSEDEAKNIAVALELYVTGSFNSFASKTNFNINKKFLIIDILEMGDQLRTVGLQVILEFLWQRVIENKHRGVRTWIWIDEFSIMFNDTYGNETQRSGDFFAKVYKRIRKHGGVVTGITQNITEVLASKQAQTMIANSEFLVLLQQKKKDLEQLVSLCDLSPSQEVYLKTGEKGSGLIVCGKKVIPFSKEIPNNSLLYEIFSTNFKEQQQKIKEQNERKITVYE